MSIAPHPSLFGRAHRLRAGGPAAAGAGVIAVSWFLAAGRPDAGDQLMFVSLALLGALGGLTAAAGLLLRGRRAIRARAALLLGSAPAASPGDIVRSAELVAGPGAKWFHRSDCLLAEGRHWPVQPGAATGRKPCPACKP